MAPTKVKQRDVFICFSKSRQGEAKVALALKHELEQNGLFAFEYEDWSWVDTTFSDDEVDVDRRTLQEMLTTCSVVVLISPHDGEASTGVQTEIAELRSCGSPVILLHWSPSGWHPLLDPPELEGLNIVWSYEGRSSGDRDVADNQSEHIARQLAVGSWLACQLHRMRSRHPRTAGALLDLIPEAHHHPLLNFQLRRPQTERNEWHDPIDVTILSGDVAAIAKDDELDAFLNDWRDGTDLMAATLADHARFSLVRPMRTFHDACESLCQQAESRLPDSRNRPRIDLKSRGLMLVRLNRHLEAQAVLQQALEVVPDEERFEVYQALAFAQQEIDAVAAIQSLTSAIDCSPQLEIACGLTYNRGVLRLEGTGDETAAIEDFSFVADRSTSTTLRHSALRARARVLTKRQEYDAAVADYTRVLADAGSTPRTAVSAWMDRGMLHHMQGRNAEAIADWSHAIDAADANALQRFRLLEARAQVLEESGQLHAAADDYEAMASYANASRDYRDELLRTVARLRKE